MMRRFRQFPTIGGRRGGIPADCVLVQYLRSTGTQYIDTGIVVTPTTGAYWKIKCNTFNDGCLGMYQSSIDMLYIDFYGNGIYFRYGNYASSKITSGFDASGVNEMSCKDGSCYLNGTSVYDGANTSSIGTNARTLYIFARNNRGSAAGYASVDLYAHKIYDGSDLVADFVPVRRVESGVSVGYMCDRLTGTLYGNAGSGAFVVGPDAGAVSARDYVQDGLIAMWDGIENAGWGTHDASATVWKDLIGTDDATLQSSCAFGDDSLVFAPTGSGDEGAIWSGTLKPVTVEICLRSDVYRAMVMQFVSSRTVAIYNDYLEGNCMNRIAIPYGVGVRDVRNTVSIEYSGAGTTVTTEKMYLNCVDSGVAFTDSWGAPTFGTIGYRQGSNAYRLRGEICCIRLYSVALTDATRAINYAVDRERYNLP